MAYGDDKIQDGWTSTGAVAASGGTTVTKTGAAGVTYMPTSVTVSSDAAALVTIESPASTVLWRVRYAAAFAATHNLAQGVVRTTPGNDLLVKISASTSNCEANISGYST